jgi:cellulose biosynthesis protein BcsQ
MEATQPTFQTPSQSGSSLEPWLADIVMPAAFERTVGALVRNLGLDLDFDGCRVIQFIGVHASDGASSVCLAAAYTSAFRLNRRVLLIEADPPGQDRDLIVRTSPAPHRDHAEIAALGNLEKNRFLLSSLWSSQRSQGVTPVPLRLHLMLRLRSRFDLIFIDSNHSALSPEGQLIASMVDGVVLVMDANHGSLELATQVGSRLKNAGAQLLGVVLNRFA